MIIKIQDNYNSHTFTETSFDRTQQSKTQVDLSGAGWVEVIVGTQTGDTQQIFKIVMHNAQTDTSTSLLLNTTEFSVIYPIKLSVQDSNFNISKEDWF